MIGQPNDSEINKRISNLEVEYFNQWSTRSGGMKYTRDQQNIVISRSFVALNSDDKKSSIGSSFLLLLSHLKY
jgi:hypothetical protein